MNLNDGNGMFIGSFDQDGAGLRVSDSLNEGVLIVSQVLFVYFLCVALKDDRFTRRNNDFEKIEA